MVTVLARGQLFSSGTACRSNALRGAVPTLRPAPFLQVRLARPVAPSYRGGYSQWDPSADAMRRMWKEFSRAVCKPGRYSSVSNGGGFFWPGGAIFTGPGAPKDWEDMMKKWQQQQQQQQQGPQWDYSSKGRSDGSPPLDVVEDELKYTLFADVPGLAKPELSIRLSKDNVLSISGERKVAAEEGLLSSERPVGPFKRQWLLPENAEGDAISAKVTDGVLTITVGKKVKGPEPEAEPDSEIPWLD